MVNFHIQSRHSGKYTDHERVIMLYDMLMLLMHFLGMRKYGLAFTKEFRGKHCMKGLQIIIVHVKLMDNCIECNSQ